MSLWPFIPIVFITGKQNGNNNHSNLFHRVIARISPISENLPRTETYDKLAGSNIKINYHKCILFFCIFFFLWLHPWNMEVSRPGIDSGYRNANSFNPLHIFRDPGLCSQILNPLPHSGKSYKYILCIKIFK